MKTASARWILATLLTVPGAAGLTAQTAAPPQSPTTETIRVEVTQREIRDSLNELGTRLAAVERRITRIDDRLRMIALDIDILGTSVQRLETSVQRLETSVENLETRLAAVEERIERMDSNIIRLQTLITDLISRRRCAALDPPHAVSAGHDPFRQRRRRRPPTPIQCPVVQDARE